MAQCFKEHNCDGAELHKSSKPIPACKSYLTEENGRKVKVTEVPVLTCDCIWRSYQREAQEIVAPGGALIADPKERNRVINAAYAKLWLHDRRFQWAGLAAFASKQVGCGLLHAADSVKKIQDEHDATERMMQSAKPVWSVPGLRVSKLDEQAQRDYEQARRNNPLPKIDARRDGDPSSWVQDQYRRVYEMLAMGNTTLFLDVFPLHAFYKKRGLKELKTCLPARSNIYGNGRFSMMWPVGQDKLKFGLEYPSLSEF